MAEPRGELDTWPEWGDNRNGETELTVPYDVEFVEAFTDWRSDNPGQARWDRKESCWWIKDEVVDHIEWMLGEYFPED